MNLHDGLASATPTPAGRLDGASIIRAADRRTARRRRGVAAASTATALAVVASTAALLTGGGSDPESLVPPAAPAPPTSPEVGVDAGVTPVPRRTPVTATVGRFGAPVVRLLADPVTVEGAGTQTVKLGPVPAGTTSLEVELTCLTPGSFGFPDGSSVGCGPSDVEGSPTTTRVPASPLATTAVITAGAGERWRFTATYSAVTTSDWGRNADGLTYGVQNERGTPDLVAVIATNGVAGYAYDRALNPPAPTTLQSAPPTPQRVVIPVYRSDGRTRVGEFVSGG